MIEGREQLFDRAENLWGTRSQLMMVCEEAGELIKEVGKIYRGKVEHDGLVDEIADMTIMLAQLQRMMSISQEQIESRIQKKLERLEYIIREMDAGNGVRVI